MTLRIKTKIVIIASALLGGAAYFADAHLPGLLAEPLPRADAVLVQKAERRLYLIRDEEPYREYTVALGANPQGHKTQEGDERTPEGEYIVDWRNPNSTYHLSLHISYPNEEDKTQAAARGVSPGGMIMIHGQRNGLGWLGGLLQRWNWTDGCVAVTNRAMEEIWKAVPDGTRITIKP
jgi:murein L,D-transpeptidase YafK